MAGSRAMNCDQERIYKFEKEINSKEDFVNLVKELSLNPRIISRPLDSFRTRKEWSTTLEIKDKPVLWDMVLNRVKTESIGNRIIYSLEYYTRNCLYTLERIHATSDGFFSTRFCCGK